MDTQNLMGWYESHLLTTIIIMGRLIEIVYLNTIKQIHNGLAKAFF